MQQTISVFRVLGARGESIIRRLSADSPPDLSRFRSKLKRRLGKPDQPTYLEYFDGWTSGHEFDLICKPAGPFERIETGWGSLLYAPASRKLAQWLQRKANRKHVQFEETRALHLRLFECLTQYDPVNSDGALLLFRRCVGVSLDDEQIRDTLKRAQSEAE